MHGFANTIRGTVSPILLEALADQGRDCLVGTERTISPILLVARFRQYYFAKMFSRRIQLHNITNMRSLAGRTIRNLKNKLNFARTISSSNMHGFANTIRGTVSPILLLAMADQGRDFLLGTDRQPSNVVHMSRLAVCTRLLGTESCAVIDHES